MRLLVTILRGIQRNKVRGRKRKTKVIKSTIIRAQGPRFIVFSTFTLHSKFRVHFKSYERGMQRIRKKSERKVRGKKKKKKKRKNNKRVRKLYVREKMKAK